MEIAEILLINLESGSKRIGLELDRNNISQLFREYKFKIN